MNSSQNGGKSKSSKSSNSKSKKGGNFLGSASELFVPTGWESFATAAGLLAIDRADAAFRRSRNSNKKQKGGADDIDAHESLDNMEQMMESMGDGDSIMSGGAKKKKPAAKKPAAKKPAAKKPAAKKPAAKKPAKKTKKSTK
jgi:hypothetical protein